MRILIKLYDNTVLTKTQQQKIRLLATIGSVLAYTSDINQCNKARKRNRSLGLKGHLGTVVYVNNVLEYLGRSHRNIQVLLRGKDIQRQKKRLENSRLLALSKNPTSTNMRYMIEWVRNQILFSSFQKQSQVSKSLFIDCFLI